MNRFIIRYRQYYNVEPTEDAHFALCLEAHLFALLACIPNTAVGSRKICSASQSRISRNPTPQVEEPTLISPKKVLTPKFKYEALDISEIGGPFERKVLIHYSYFRPI